MNKFCFRNKNISFKFCYPNDSTFYFIFGERELFDSKKNEYVIQLKYHITEDKWITEIWLEDEPTCIYVNELTKINTDEYITEQEIEDIKEFAKQFIRLRKKNI